MSEGARVRSSPCPADSASIRASLARGENPLHHPASVFRRGAFEAVGGYRKAFVHAEDLDLWMRLSELGELANLPDVVLLRRVHGGQVSFVHIEQQVLSATGALVAARERAEGRPGPFEGAAPVDRNSLARRGTDLVSVEHTIVDRFQIAANAALARGRTDDALAAVDALAGVKFVGRQAAREAFFEVNWIRARCRLAKGEPVRAVLFALLASRWPRKWLERLRRAVARRLGCGPGGHLRD